MFKRSPGKCFNNRVELSELGEQKWMPQAEDQTKLGKAHHYDNLVHNPLKGKILGDVGRRRGLGGSKLTFQVPLCDC